MYDENAKTAIRSDGARSRWDPLAHGDGEGSALAQRIAEIDKDYHMRIEMLDGRLVTLAGQLAPLLHRHHDYQSELGDTLTADREPPATPIFSQLEQLQGGFGKIDQLALFVENLNRLLVV